MPLSLCVYCLHFAQFKIIASLVKQKTAINNLRVNRSSQVVGDFEFKKLNGTVSYAYKIEI
jgi:hypothetical protein